MAASDISFDHPFHREYDPEQLFENQILTVRDAAQLLKFSTKTIYKLVRRGEIPHKLVGSEIRFLQSELMCWMKGERP